MNAPTSVSLRQEPLPETIGESGGLGFRLIVAPLAGRIRHLPPARFHDGEEWVSPGQPVAVVEHGNVVVKVESPVEARVAGVLVRDGEPVLKGQPIVWLDESPRRAEPGGEGATP
jgi:biotin carboxyl carrier protein